MKDALLVVDDLVKEFPAGRRSDAPVRAVDGVSFTVRRGETFGVVGESGCGKSTLTRAILRLLEPTAGTVAFDGIDVRGLGTQELRRLRRRVQIVFQDPLGSLDPRMTARAIVEEPLEIHGIGDRVERARRASAMLELVGIPPAQHGRKPYAFSGGQRQRIGVARALVLEPDLVFLDEPISALDVSIQAQVLNLLRELQQRLGLTYVFIVHDLAVAEYFCDRVAVLYRGAVMELASSEAIFREPLHPYTSSLLSAVPIPDPEIERRRDRVVLRGDVTPLAPQAGGCRFRDRCPVGRDRAICAEQEPPLAEHRPGQLAACHFPGELQGVLPHV
ncbi:ABC transporter ATP-binding protein [Candidatus Solirubrobacter pratensis]|uniref:ABC transporter ATP-binding protein n=1 Tax=Candidatus Solirubrobacter pratensis TaxID=1298857 RepID=UPI00040F8A11|nr:oligopeptide/dipeptide ABC transporter ATP-binding protein [Candidatus Solirubrobacter pratensis]